MKKVFILIFISIILVVARRGFTAAPKGISGGVPPRGILGPGGFKGIGILGGGGGGVSPIQPPFRIPSPSSIGVPPRGDLLPQPVSIPSSPLAGPGLQVTDQQPRRFRRHGFLLQQNLACQQALAQSQLLIQQQAQQISQLQNQIQQLQQPAQTSPDVGQQSIQ